MPLPALALLGAVAVGEELGAANGGLVGEVLRVDDGLFEGLAVGEALGVALGEEVLAVQISAEKSSPGAVLLQAESPMLPIGWGVMKDESLSQ